MTLKMPLRILPIPESFADEARRAGHAPRVVEEAHSAPCRVCLEDARPGEAVLLCRYSPFAHDVPHSGMMPTSRRTVRYTNHRLSSVINAKTARTRIEKNVGSSQSAFS